MYIDLKTLSSSQGFKIFGANSGDVSGIAVSGVGDVNQDGIDDIAVGASGASPFERNLAGEIYVIYGRKGGYADFILGSSFNSSYGFRIVGASANDRSGISISKACDINFDGIDDIIIGAYTASPLDRSNAGISYVIYGKKDGYDTDIDLDQLTIVYGFKILGENSGDQSGFSVKGAHDVNGDGIGDIIIGAPTASPSGLQKAGVSYVIYGKKGGYIDIDLNSTLNRTIGFKIFGANSGDQSGNSISGAGDINKDGLNDIIIGAREASPLNRNGAGISYVIYGVSGSYRNDIYLGSLSNTDGFSIMGAEKGDRSAGAVSEIGDVNFDGIDDIIIGAFAASPSNRSNAGISYVIYGKKGGYSTIIDLNNFDISYGFKILGSASADIAGSAVSSAGDVNDDGILDVLIGAVDASPLSRDRAGISYVIYGKRNGYTNVDLNQLDDIQGFMIVGSDAGELSSWSVSGNFDVNLDGIADVIIGAPWANNRAGESYVIYGRTTTTQNYCMLSQVVKFISINSQDSSGKIDVVTTGTWCNSDSLFIGDFNGDGKQDLLCSLRNGENYVMLSQDKSFLPMGSDPSGRIKIGANDKWCSKDVQELHIGDFNNDKKSDLLCRVNVHEADEGSNYVMLSTGSGFEPITNTTDGAINIGKLGKFCFAGSRLVVGNFDGQGGDDLFCNNPTGGSIVNMLMVSNGTSFVSANANILGAVQMGQTDACQPVWCVESGSKIMTGDFNGDGKADLLCNANGVNKIMLSMLSQSGFCDFKPISTDGNGTIAMGQGTWPLWCDTSKSTLVTADVDGDTLSDLVCNDNGVNQIMLCKKISNNNYRFDSFNINNPKDIGNTSMAGNDKWCPSQNILAGDINGDTLDDIWCNQGDNVLGRASDSSVEVIDID